MSIKISVDHGADLTVMKATDRISREEIEQVIVDFYAHQPTRKVVWDLNAASISHFKASDLKKIVEVIGKRFTKRSGAQTAIVTNQDSDFGMVRMGEAFAHDLPVDFMVFRSRELADRWLNGVQ